MISRERILEAAERVYSKHGFRGATTRLIASEAGVNEVTLFRTFGSKGALLEAVLTQHHDSKPVSALPLEPVDPQRELTDWIQTSLEHVRTIRPLLVHSMGEIEERPQAAEFACRGRRIAHDSITAYVRALQAQGMADHDADPDAAAVMLMGTVMSDAIARTFVPDLYPPMDEAAERYATAFLRSLGLKTIASSPVRRARKHA